MRSNLCNASRTLASQLRIAEYSYFYLFIMNSKLINQTQLKTFGVFSKMSPQVLRLFMSLLVCAPRRGLGRQTSMLICMVILNRVLTA